MQLHILGPAFGLPSIDAECIAAVALLKCYAQSSGRPWGLVASHEAAPGTQLPYLDDNGLFSGFDKIAQHLAEISGGEIPGLATVSTSQQQADATALSTFIKTEGQLLLDISLYVSFENYRNRTRSAFTKILPWYANFVIPPQRRAEARQRTAHLGVSSVDVDDVHEDVMEKPASMQSQQQQQKPFEHDTEKHAKRLLGRKDTVRSLLQKPEHAALFRLNALADDFFEPLQDILGNRSNLLGTEQPALIDCLAFGYLSLIFYPKMPQNWLASTMRSKYGKLVVYLGSLRDTLHINAHPDEALTALSQPQKGKGAADLPWVSHQSFSLGAVTSYICQSLYAQLPLPETGKVIEPLPTTRPTPLLRRYLPLILGSTTSLFALFGYWAWHNLTWPHGEAVQIFGRRKMTDYGAAGVALSALGNLGMQMQQEMNFQQHQQSQSPLKVDVEVDEQVSS